MYPSWIKRANLDIYLFSILSGHYSLHFCGGGVVSVSIQALGNFWYFGLRLLTVLICISEENPS
ncbi:hypothetical protein HanIR_Chr08g0359851 [Helianthus annuus]|nr:hypothetical protein HanIR_Chr08g0359851 [Helianthus annuus]